MAPAEDDDTAEIARVIDAIRRDLGAETSWPTPVLLDGLALCIMNSILSTGNRSESVVRVLDRYRRRRQETGGDPALDGPKELLAEINACGGPDGFADALGNHWRAWSRKTAPYKTEVILQAAQLLDTASIQTKAQLLTHLEQPSAASALKRGWYGLPGQRSGLTWRYFLMNTGLPGIKADRMILRWAERALGRRSTAAEVERLLTDAASRLGVESRRLDHALWSHERLQN